MVSRIRSAVIEVASLDIRHVVRRGASARFCVPENAWAGANQGYSRWSVLDETTPAVHTAFGICRLDAGGQLSARVHSCEENFFILDGTLVLQCLGYAALLEPGDYGMLPVGAAHSWHNESGAPVRWVEMLAPPPRARFGANTFPVPALSRTPPESVAVLDPSTTALGHVDPVRAQPEKRAPERRPSSDPPPASASQRTALLVSRSITMTMMVDAEAGAEQATMFLAEYASDGPIGRHHHPFEETYLFLQGTVETEFDGTTYVLGPGDIAFAGIGCVHAFRNIGNGPLRWLETQSPQPTAG